MRNATAYGASPRLRLDIVVNNLVGAGFSSGEVRLQSDGTPWRPLVHVQDISRAALATLDAPRELVHDEAFNVGRDLDNIQVGAIAELVADALPGARITRAPGAGPDLRDYRVDFSKLGAIFPDLSLTWSVAQGIHELVTAYAEYGMSVDDFTSSRYTRLRRIEALRAAEIVDAELRRIDRPVTVGAP
jgi:nucleoside-diphosphate-sugar epimerase